MDTVQLLAKFADPQTIDTLTSTERLMAGLATTVLGMGITLVALIVLQFVTALLGKIFPTRTAALQPEPQPTAAPIVEAGKQDNSDEELVAAITVALAMQLETPASNIIIRNIRKVEDSSPTWNKVGLAEQMTNNS